MKPGSTTAFALLVVVACVAGCAGAPSAPAVAASGCDMRIDVRGDHRCVLTPVSPLDPEAQLIASIRRLELSLRH